MEVEADDERQEQQQQLKTPLLAGGISEVVSPLMMPEFGRVEDIPDCGLEGPAVAGATEAEQQPTVDGLFRRIAAVPNEVGYEDDDNDNDGDIPWYANAQQFSAMLSNFSTSYNVVNISLVLPILEVAQQQQQSASSKAGDDEPPDEDAVAAVASSLLAGMMLGQVLGGLAGDVLGAGRALVLAMMLQVAASLGSATAATSAAETDRVFWRLAAWRFVLGIGAGGVYPLAATLSASATTPPHRNKNSTSSSQQNQQEHHHHAEDSTLHRVVLTFSTQGLGFVMVPLLAVPLLYILPHNLNAVWRILLALGSLPGIALMIWQFQSTRSQQQYSTTAAPVPARSTLTDDQQDNNDTSMPPIARAPTSHSLSSQHGVIPPPDHCSDDSREESDEENESVLDSLPDPPNASSIWTLSSQPQQQSSPDAAATEDEPSSAPQQPIDEDYHHYHPHGWWDSVRNEPDLGRKLLGTAATWFLFDALFYGNTLFEPIVIEAAFGARQHANPVHLLQRAACDSLILTSIALPGYAIAGLVLGKNTRWCYCGAFRQTTRFVMLQGFAAMAVLYFLIGVFWSDLRRSPTLLVTLYGMSFFFANYGPNTTTFVLPSLVYSPECRSTFNGLSAAAGKFGALTGASLFEPAADALGDAATMLICAGIAVLALVMTKFFVPKSHTDADDHPEPIIQSNAEEDGNEQSGGEQRPTTIV